MITHAWPFVVLRRYVPALFEDEREAYTAIDYNDPHLPKSAEIALDILERNAVLLSSLAPDPEAFIRNATCPKTKRVFTFEPSIYVNSGTSGSGGEFVATFCAYSGCRPKPRMAVSCSVLLNGKLGPVSDCINTAGLSMRFSYYIYMPHHSISACLNCSVAFA